MKIPSDEWIEELQQRCNADSQFNRASEWSDVNLVVEVGNERYWLKLYGGKIIDTMKYEPISNPLGYDVVVSGSQSTWTSVASGEMPFWEAYSTGKITIDGNLLEANRMHEAIVRMADLMDDSQQVEVNS